MYLNYIFNWLQNVQQQAVFSHLDKFKCPKKVIGTDSWDTTELNDHDAAYALVGRSYVIIPDSSAGESLFGKRSLTSELFSEMSPRKQRKRK